MAALPPAPAGGGAGDELNNRTRQVLDLVEEARHRLDVDDGQARMDTPDEVEDVVRRLADARYELAAIDALRNGRPVPEKTAPCFFDPRHGPSVDERPFTPEFGLERQVPVCARCAEEIDAGRKPAARTFSLSGVVKPYWEWDRYTRPYVNGYWQRTHLRRPGGATDPVRTVTGGVATRQAGLERHPVRVGERRRLGRVRRLRRWRSPVLRQLRLPELLRRRQLQPILPTLRWLPPLLTRPSAAATALPS